VRGYDVRADLVFADKSCPFSQIFDE